MMRKRCLLLLLLGFGLAPVWTGALELGPAGSLSGSYKNLFFHTKDSQDDVISTDLNRLRMEVQGAYDSLSWRLVYDHEVLLGNLLRSPDFEVLKAVRDPTFVDLEATIRRDRSLEWRHLIYRILLRWEHTYGHVTMGRQRIAWGSGRLWNPTDFFNPVSPTAIELGQKVGVDALMLTFNRGSFGALQLVGAPGRDERGIDHKGAIRWRDTVGETDYALLLGTIDDNFLLGIDITTNLFDGGWRLETLFSQLNSGKTETRLIVGYDYRLTNSVFPAGLHLQAEYFYNSSATALAAIGESPVIAREPPNLLETRSHHQLGLSANYDLTALWNVAGLAIIDLEEGSYFFAPNVTWSVTAHIDLTAAVQLFGGGTGSEFGDNNNLYLVQWEVFF